MNIRISCQLHFKDSPTIFTAAALKMKVLVSQSRPLFATHGL